MNRLIKALTTLCITLLLNSCGCNPIGPQLSALSRLSQGMSKQQAVDAIGYYPDSTSVIAGREFLTYSLCARVERDPINRCVNGCLSKEKHVVVLDNGIVTEWGRDRDIGKRSTTTNRNPYLHGVRN